MTQPPLNGCKAPDWFYVPNVPPMLDGRRRRSYVLWKERVPPRIVIEFVSGSGAEERDDREFHGKFWIYEQGIAAEYYAILDWEPVRLEVYHRVDGKYQLMPANEHGHYPIAEMGVALGLWTGRFTNIEWSWLRWYFLDGSLVPISDERAELERQRAEAQAQRAESEAQRAESEAQRAESEAQRAESEAQRAESEAQRATASPRNCGNWGLIRTSCNRSNSITSCTIVSRLANRTTGGHVRIACESR